MSRCFSKGYAPRQVSDKPIEGRLGLDLTLAVYMNVARQFCMLALAHFAISANADEVGFAAMDQFIATTKYAKRLVVSAAGALDNKGNVYHAELVQLDQNPRHQQILIFRTSSNGEYLLIDQSKKMDNMGGSGSWSIQSLEFKNNSLFVTFGGHWHHCSDSYTSQFKLKQGALREIGIESWQDNIERNLAVSSSVNFLTGKAYSIGGSIETMYSTNKGKRREYVVPRKQRPLSDFDSEPYHLPYNREHPVC